MLSSWAKLLATADMIPCLPDETDGNLKAMIENRQFDVSLVGQTRGHNKKA
jgi:hypothetical protein